VAGFYRYAVEEEPLSHSPAAHVRRPRLDYESHATGLDRNELGALLVAAGLGPPAEHALFSLLALNGLRVCEATGAEIQALGVERGHRTLVITRKGGKVVTIPLAPRTARAIDLAIDERSEGPIFLAPDGRRLDRHGAARIDRTFQSVSNVILPLVVRRLRYEHPGCDIRLLEEETDQPQVSELDLIFFDGRVDGDVEHLKLLDDPHLLVARPGVFPDGPVPLAQLDGAPMVAHPLICDQARMEQALAHASVRPHIVFRTVGNEAVLSMVRAGMGTALLPRLAILGPDTRADTLHPRAPANAPATRDLLALGKGTHPLTPRSTGHRDRRRRRSQDRRGK